MCTLIYWAKLVPLRHINIDEEEEEALEVRLNTRKSCSSATSNWTKTSDRDDHGVVVQNINLFELHL